jgi:signal transduction histidine kinase
MRRRGSITMRHLVVAVLVVVVVNAQLTWWIIFVLGQNRSRLRLERAELLHACRLAAARITTSVSDAQLALTAAVVGGQRPPGDFPPAPFAEWRYSTTACTAGWTDDGSGIVLRLVDGNGCVEATVEQPWRERLFELEADVQLISSTSPDRDQPPGVALPEPFSDRAVAPTEAAWSRILEGYRDRIKMMVFEGSFFAVLLFVLIALLFRTLRREAELERRHRNFLSAITHELKSPLASVRLSIETVLQGRADRSASEKFLANALSDTGRLQDLVQKVLEVTRYDRGGGDLELHGGCLSDVVEDAVAAFSRRVAATGTRIEADLEPGIRAHVNEEAFAIVVSNLLENAAKYGGEDPRIDVRLAVVDRGAVLEVQDNGPGISDREIPFIFDRFYRAGDELTRTTNGTGLGLYLVKQIVTAHRGTVDVAATGPNGTIFRVTLPGAQPGETSI